MGVILLCWVLPVATHVGSSGDALAKRSSVLIHHHIRTFRSDCVMTTDCLEISFSQQYHLPRSFTPAPATTNQPSVLISPHVVLRRCFLLWLARSTCGLLGRWPHDTQYRCTKLDDEFLLPQ